MRTVFSSKPELCHLWAHKSQPQGVCGNMFFVGDSIYSYGRHFEIARHIGNNTILFTTRGYSVSTARHIRYVASATSHMQKVYVYDFVLTSGLIGHYKAEIKALLNKAVTARKKEKYTGEARRLYNELLNYSLVMKHTDKATKKALAELDTLSATNPSDFAVYIEKEQAKKARAEKLAAKKRIKENAEREQKWLVNELAYYYSPDKCVFRISKDGEDVESSQGARVPLYAAMILWEMIKRKKPVHGHTIGNYQVISYDGKILQIGCHKIEQSELDRFGKILDSLKK